MTFNISMLQDYATCPYMAYLKHVKLIARAGGSIALTEGTMFHLAMEDKLLGRPARGAQELFIACDNPRDGAIGEWEKHGLSDVIEHWDRPAEWTPHAVEQVLGAHLGGMDGQGKLDSTIKMDGYWWSEQHKTYTQDLDALIQKVRLSWHEVWYQHLLEVNGYGPVAGTILNACQKLPGYKLVDMGTGKKQRVEVTPEMRRAALTTHYITRTDEEQARILASIEEYVRRMREDFTEHINLDAALPRVNQSCWDFNNKCGFYGHCWEGDELVAPQFIQLTPRY